MECRTLVLSALIALSLGTSPVLGATQSGSPFDDKATQIEKSLSKIGSESSTIAPLSAGETSQASGETSSTGGAPALEAPPHPGAKGVTTASAQFKTWLEKAHVYIDKWNFPEGVVNKYGKTITREDYLKAIIWIESNGVHKSPGGKLKKSCVGALGFMQLMPATAKGMGFDASDPAQNLKAGTKYLVELFNCDGVTMAKTPEEKLIKACCAYNAGPYSSFVQRTWDKLKMGKNYETIGYGLKLKMCLGLELTESEKNLVPKVLDCKKSQVESLINEFYSNANGLF